MSETVVRMEQPRNEPVMAYAPGSSERAELKQALSEMAGQRRELPCVIDGKAVTTDSTVNVVSPHRHQRVVGKAFQARPGDVEAAVNAALRARHDWTRMSFMERAGVFLRAAELLATRWRSTLNAATMLGQSKTAHQAEIDSACELIDFWRFNVYFARKIQDDQPISTGEIHNRTDYRGLDGFVLAITPFNFTAIAGNLPTAPALMGNTVVWKPAPTQALAAQYIMDLLQEAGLPAGVINLVHGVGPELEGALKHPDLAGLHFTGSTHTFQHLWRQVGENISNYHGYPRIVGETGGKDFVVVHASADVDEVATGLVRGAFEFQGQKCSAASRAYVPKSMWPALSEKLVAEISALKVGDVADFKNFMGAVIDQRAFDKIKGYIDVAKAASDMKILVGGDCNASEGYFIQPTIVMSENPRSKLMVEEIFGPVLTVHVYDDQRFEEVLELCDTSTPYGLTGAIFARDRAAVVQAQETLRFTAGNFYVNDKPTGAVVGQQPFGGGRASGTNDKAGSMWNLIRWASPRTIKENFAPPKSVAYPFMKDS